MAIKNYPGGWDTLGNITHLKDTIFKPVSGTEYKYIELANIGANGEITECIIEKGQNLPSRARHKVNSGDVIVSSIEGSLDSIALITEEYDGALCSTGFHVINSDVLNSEILFAFMKSRAGQLQLKKGCSGTILTAINKSEFKKVVLPLFIASKLFRLSIVDTVRNSISCLSRSKQIYGEAQTFFLSNFCIANWRPGRKLTYVKSYADTRHAERMDAEYFQPKYDDIINTIKEYPGGWETLGNLVTLKKCVEIGSREYFDEGIPFIRVSNLDLFEITEEKYISEELYTALLQHQPEQGEILLSKDGTPGIAYHFREQPPKMIPASGILRLKCKTDRIRAEYLALVLNSILIQEQVNRDVGGSLIPHWRTNRVASTLIPLLPEEKQVNLQQKVIEAFNLRNQSKHLLQCAKRAVEIAIEQDEQTALDWLERESRARPKN